MMERESVDDHVDEQEGGDEVLYLEKLDSLKELKYEWT